MSSSVSNSTSMRLIIFILSGLVGLGLPIVAMLLFPQFTTYNPWITILCIGAYGSIVFILGKRLWQNVIAKPTTPLSYKETFFEELPLPQPITPPAHLILLSSCLVGHTGAVRSVAWSPDGTLVASASADRTVRLWDASTGQAVRTLAGHTDAVFSVARWHPVGLCRG